MAKPDEPQQLYRAFIAACAECSQAGVAWATDWTAAEERLVIAHLPPGEVLLAGCGTGRGIERLLVAGRRVLALDRDPGMCAVIRRRFASARVEVVEGAIEAADELGVDRFSAVLCLGLVSGGLFLPGGDPVRALRALVSGLRSDGVLLLDFLEAGATGAGRLVRFDFPLGPGRTTPGCCFWPSRAGVRRALAAAGLWRVKFVRLLHDPDTPLVGAVAVRGPQSRG